MLCNRRCRVLNAMQAKPAYPCWRCSRWANMGSALSALSPTTGTSSRTRWNRHTRRSMKDSSASTHPVFVCWTSHVAHWGQRKQTYRRYSSAASKTMISQQFSQWEQPCWTCSASTKEWQRPYMLPNSKHYHFSKVSDFTDRIPYGSMSCLEIAKHQISCWHEWQKGLHENPHLIRRNSRCPSQHEMRSALDLGYASSSARRYGMLPAREYLDWRQYRLKFRGSWSRSFPVTFTRQWSSSNHLAHTVNSPAWRSGAETCCWRRWICRKRTARFMSSPESWQQRCKSNSRTTKGSQKPEFVSRRFQWAQPSRSTTASYFTQPEERSHLHLRSSSRSVTTMTLSMRTAYCTRERSCESVAVLTQKRITGAMAPQTCRQQPSHDANQRSDTQLKTSPLSQESIAEVSCLLGCSAMVKNVMEAAWRRQFSKPSSMVAIYQYSDPSRTSTCGQSATGGTCCMSIHKRDGHLTSQNLDGAQGVCQTHTCAAATLATSPPSQQESHQRKSATRPSMIRTRAQTIWNSSFPKQLQVPRHSHLSQPNHHGIFGIWIR